MFTLTLACRTPWRPGGRPTTLFASLALRDGEACLAFGTRRDQQDQWNLGFFLRHVLDG